MACTLEPAAQCFNDQFTYDSCCRPHTLPLIVPREVARSRHLEAHGWCGMACIPHSPEARTRWEFLRMLLLDSLHAPAGAPLLFLDPEYLDRFEEMSEDARRKECAFGAAVYGALQGVLKDTSLFAEEYEKNWRFLSQVSWQTFYCAGWPVFGLLDMVLKDTPKQQISFVHDLYNQTRCSPVFRAVFESRAPTLPALQAAVTACRDCLGATLPCMLMARRHFGRIHRQQAAIWGYGVCPTGSYVTWMDQVAGLPPIAICVRAKFNYIDHAVKQNGKWVNCETDMVLVATDPSEPQPGAHVIDAGANIGACSLLMAKLGFRVISLEPLPEHLKMLFGSLVLNGAVATNNATRDGQVRVIVGAGGSKASTAVVGVASDGLRFSNSGTTEIFPVERRHLQFDQFRVLGRSVPVHTVASAVRDIPMQDPIHLLKIDVEGSELEVLRGARDLLISQRIRRILIEFWPPHLKRHGEYPMDLPWFLRSHGYDIYYPEVVWRQWLIAKQTVAPDAKIVSLEGCEDKPECVGKWALVPPSQFEMIQGRWTDILAVAKQPWNPGSTG
mmetsp:Transcript_41414/g.108880  ORF Transcript_41414/g.108880 Transcript_41414/m.108880 type:complete len:557 (+) Transcript_41414:54-1724(+)